MNELLKKIAELEKSIAAAEGAKKDELSRDLVKAKEELAAVVKKMEELEKENKDLRAKSVEAELSAMVSEGKILESQKEIAKALMLDGKEAQVKELFSKPNPMKGSDRPAGLVISGAASAKVHGDAKAIVIPYTEFSKMPIKERLDIIGKMEDPKSTQKIVIADDFWGRSEGQVKGISPFEQFSSSHKMEEFAKTDNGMIELASYDAGVGQKLSGSNLLPKVWESKVIYDMGAMQYGFAAVAMNATVANAQAVQWNLIGTLAAQGTNVDYGTTTGTTGITITPVTLNPQWYGNSVTWEGNVGDWSVSNVKDNIVYPALLRDYKVTMDTEALNVVLAASAVLDANTVAGGTFGRGTAAVASIGTFTGAYLTPQNALVGKTILAANGAMKFPDESYICFAAPEQLYSVQAGTGWLLTMQYADSARLLSGEYGKWMGIRFVENSAIKPVTKGSFFGATGTGTFLTAVMVGAQALGKGFDIDFQLAYYPDFTFDAGRFKKLQWNARGRFARLRTAEVVKIMTAVDPLLGAGI